MGKIRDAKTEQTMTKIRDAKTEQTMTSQECLRMSAQKPVKGGQPSPFLNLLIYFPESVHNRGYCRTTKRII